MFLILEELVKIIKKRKLYSLNENKSYTYKLLKNKELWNDALPFVQIGSNQIDSLLSDYPGMHYYQQIL